MRLGWILDLLTFGYLAVVALVFAFGPWGERGNALTIVGAMLLLGAAKFMVHAAHRVTQFRIIWVAAPFVGLLTISLVYMFLYDLTCGSWQELVCLVLMILWLSRELWRVFRGRSINPVQPTAGRSAVNGD